MKPSNMRSVMKKLIITSVSLLAVILTAVAALAATEEGAQDITTTYHYDAETETWLKDVSTVSLPDNPDGTKPKGSNTVIIRLSENNPVKQIVVIDGLVLGGNEPRLEIAGHDTGGSGELHIGTLLFKKVDADRLEFHDTDAVDVQMQNVVAQDNELDMDVNIVNVVRTGRGGASSLFIGATRAAFEDFLTSPGIPSIDSIPDNFITAKETGVRVDRIRILGPSSGDAFVERIIFLHSSIFGKIEVKDAKIQEIVLKDVTLDDSTP
ncbi:MAG: hypothetical protein HY529_05740 [Chloroflexi bacterium]|nr:hypothetical protein [Chloroflexota bacterium]